MRLQTTQATIEVGDVVRVSTLGPGAQMAVVERVFARSARVTLISEPGEDTVSVPLESIQRYASVLPSPPTVVSETLAYDGYQVTDETNRGAIFSVARTHSAAEAARFAQIHRLLAPDSVIWVRRTVIYDVEWGD